MSRRQIKTVQLPNDIRLKYVEQGDESGVLVLLLHGVTDSWHSFDLMVEYRDSGHAPHWEEPHRFASDLVEFVEGRRAETRD